MSEHQHELRNPDFGLFCSCGAMSFDGGLIWSGDRVKVDLFGWLVQTALLDRLELEAEERGYEPWILVEHLLDEALPQSVDKLKVRGPSRYKRERRDMWLQ